MLKKFKEENVLEDHLEEFEIRENKILGTKAIIALVVIIIFLGLTNVLITTLALAEYSNIINKNADKSREFFSVSISVFILLPAISFVAAFLLSLIPFKKHNYSSKYFPFALFTLLALQIVLFFLLISDRL